MMQKSTFEKLREIYPWPSSRPLSKDDSFDWSLTTHGREVLAPIFEKAPPTLMAEISSFLGGSALQWLKTNPNLKLICVDPFPNTSAAYVRSLIDVPWAANFGKENLRRYADLLAKNGTLKVVQNNLWDFRDRVVLVRKDLNEATVDLAGLTPDIVFMSGVRTQDEFALADRLFPEAIVAGDCWNWVSKRGYVPVPRLAGAIAKRRGAYIYAKGATYVICKLTNIETLKPFQIAITTDQAITTDGERTKNPYARVYDEFPAWEGVVPAGYHAGWMGQFALLETFYSRSFEYLENLKKSSQQPTYRKTQQPSPSNPTYYETGAVLHAVLGAKKTFRMMELGAGIGPWTVLAAKASEYRGLSNRLFVAVEAEPTRFKWLSENLAFNGIAENERAPLRAVVFPSDKQSAEVYFPVGEPNFAGHSATTDASVKEVTVEYGGRRVECKLEAAPVVSLRSILETHGGIFDLIHMDVQGVEYDVIKDAADLLNGSIRAFCIETHSDQIDKDLPILFKSLGWQCLVSWGFWDDFEMEGEIISARGLGGFQHWVNPALT